MIFGVDRKKILLHYELHDLNKRIFLKMRKNKTLFEFKKKKVNYGKVSALLEFRSATFFSLHFNDFSPNKYTYN